MNNTELSNSVFSKKNSLENSRLKTTRALTKFDDENGIMLISANDDTLGDIIYINDRAAEVLEENIQSVIGNKFWNYVPHPYQENHPK